MRHDEFRWPIGMPLLQVGILEGELTMATRKPRSTEPFTTLDEVLDQDGTREAFQAVAIKEVLAWQIEETIQASARLADCSIPQTATE